MLNKSVTKVVTFVEDGDKQGFLPFSHSYTALREVSVSARRPRSSPIQSGRQGQADIFARPVQFSVTWKYDVLE